MEIVIEVIVIVALVAFFGYLIGDFIYRKRKNLPTGACRECSYQGNNLLRMYKKKYKHK